MVGASTDRGRDRVEARRKQQEHRRKYRRDQDAAGETLHDAKEQQHREVAAPCAADRGKREHGDADDEQKTQAQHPREQAGQRDRDDLGDQIGGLDPAHRVG